MVITCVQFALGAICGILLIAHVGSLKKQRDRAAEDYVKLSNTLIGLACTGPEDEGDKECHHQELLKEHRRKGCIEIYDD